MSVDFDRMAAHLPAGQRKELGRQYRRGAKNETAAFLSAFFLGIFGVHHFYLGEWVRGLAHLIIPALVAIAVAAGVLGGLPTLPVTIVVVVLLLAALIWEIVDLFQIDSTVRQRNVALAESLIGAGALTDNAALTEAVTKLDSAMTSNAAVGAITAEDVSAARAMAGEHNNAIMEEYASSTTKFISDDPNETSPGAPGSWSETAPYQSLATPSATEGPSAGDTLDMPAPEYVTHTHTETENSVTDSYQFDRTPDATQPMPIPTPQQSEATTWPDHPPLEEVAGAAGALGAGALLADVSDEPTANVAGVAGPDNTDHHAYVRDVQPIADVEGTGAAPQYVTLPEEQPTMEVAGFAPLAVDASTTARDATDSHPQVHHTGLVADMDVNPGQPVYVDLPGETYSPPAAPQVPADAADTLVGPAGISVLGAGYLASHADEPQGAPEATPEPAPEVTPDVAPEATVEAAPISGPLMKRIRMKRQIVVDGQVVREEVVEKLVPVDTDTSAMVAEMDTELGHASKEEIAHMANLDPETSLDLRQRLDLPHQSD